ncbi:FAD-binding oxidoreductase [uncultured Kordia sp.]|uniref:NAD(P)/FAD-dependent oxidoreductase n=1 Tax=uncultured Kordia sp. TaxID=507699 RepID=UPI00262F9258|nr:FAD-binding oxidoreductase [uncultured Kordia sp.]
MVDYIIVGLGLAGIAFCEELEAAGKEFIVYEDNSQHSSTVAGGLYNPVILKRFTPAWNADEQLEIALPFYERLERKLATAFDEKISVVRRFSAIEEQNMWFEASDKPKLSKYLDATLIQNKNKAVEAPFALGKVKKTGRVNTRKLLTSYREYLSQKNAIKKERFQYNRLTIEKKSVSYQDIKAKKIIFCEGFGAKSNPYFDYLPLKGTKGELLFIKAPDLKIDYVLKSSVFLIPQGDDIYTVGATYDWKDKTHAITEKARLELIEKLSKLINCNYEIIDQVAGIRPTVIDRRPLIGMHPVHSNLIVLNGLGTRGVMVGPTIAKQLYDHLACQKELPSDVNIKRFEDLYNAN